jgi:ornithine cyclodeaminase
MQILDAQSVADALPYGQLIEALRDAFAGDIDVPLRAHHEVPVPGGTDGTLLLMPAWQAGQDMGVKIATVFPDNASRSLPAVHASYFLMDGTSGVPKAVLDGTELTVRRTAAASALASSYLSRGDAATLLIVGTGNLAPCLIEAHATVRSIQNVVIWGRRREAAEQLSARIAPLSMSVAIADDLEAAAREADIISCATLSPDPLILGNWLSSGQHLDLVGAFKPDMREADSAAVAKASVYVDTRAGALSEAGEIVQAIEEGAITERDICGDLSALARGEVEGRSSADQVTLFKSVGTALEDLAAARLAVDNSSS